MKTIMTSVMTAVANGEIVGAGTITIATASTVTVNGITTSSANTLIVMQKYLGATLPLPQNGKTSFVATIDANGGVVVTEP